MCIRDSSRYAHGENGVIEMDWQISNEVVVNWIMENITFYLQFWREGNWTGQVSRGKGILMTVVESTVEGESRRGRKLVAMIVDVKREGYKWTKNRPQTGTTGETMVYGTYHLGEHHTMNETTDKAHFWVFDREQSDKSKMQLNTHKCVA